MQGQYRVVRIIYDKDNAVRFTSSWVGFDQACRVLKILIDQGDNAKIESYDGGAR